jgi:Tfp pilus assembly protein PilX
MKTPNPKTHHRSESGFAVAVVLALLSIMVILVVANARNLAWLRREVRLVEKHQVDRLDASSGSVATNQPPSP